MTRAFVDHFHCITMAALDKAANGITGDSGLAAIRPLQLTAGGEDEKILDDTVTKAFNIIYAYRLQKSADAHDKWVEGTPKFLSIIKHYVRTKSVIRRCMPAFPFKSANKNFKVLGTLPDRAEQVALTRLNIMCAEIEAIYKSGAKLLIISDGLVYNGGSEFANSSNRYAHYLRNRPSHNPRQGRLGLRTRAQRYGCQNHLKHRVFPSTRTRRHRSPSTARRDNLRSNSKQLSSRLVQSVR